MPTVSQPLAVRRKWTVTGVAHAGNDGCVADTRASRYSPARSDAAVAGSTKRGCAAVTGLPTPPEVPEAAIGVDAPVALSSLAHCTEYDVASVATPAATAALPNVISPLLAIAKSVSGFTPASQVVSTFFWRFDNTSTRYSVARGSLYCAFCTTARIISGVNLDTIRAAQNASSGRM